LKTKLIVSALAIAATMSIAPAALAQKKGGAETSLVGIKLYDSGLRVVSIYGTPDAVQSVGGGGNAIGPGGGGAPGGPAGGPPGDIPGIPGGGRGGKGGAAGAAADMNPGSFGDDILQGGKGAAGVGAPSPGPGGQGAPGAPGVGPGGGPAGPGGGGMSGGGTSSGRILYTRWVYNRNGSKYGFVLDKSNRVVQIEAIGLSNSKVKTARGATFGTTFAQLIKKYNAPDGYEINGDNVVVRFLVRNKVAFRLSRLGPNKPQVVTGIVVAAGKT
jgi:hypothetical protein